MTQDEESQVREALIAWRLATYNEQLKGNILDTEQTVMMDSMLEKVTKTFKSITESHLVNWNPFFDSFMGEVVSIAIDFANQFEKERKEKEELWDQEKKRKQLEKNPPWVQVSPMGEFMTTRQE